MNNTERPPTGNAGEPLAFDERTRRVLELRKQVREGTYKPDPEVIARAILAEWFELGLELEREAEPPALESAEQRREAGARFIVEPRGADSEDEEGTARTA